LRESEKRASYRSIFSFTSGKGKGTWRQEKITTRREGRPYGLLCCHSSRLLLKGLPTNKISKEVIAKGAQVAPFVIFIEKEQNFYYTNKSLGKGPAPSAGLFSA
jgi:hypothetical protein